MADKKNFVVSLVFTKDNRDGTLNISNSVRTVIANNENESFGIAYDSCIDKYKTHQLHSQVIYENKINHDNTKLKVKCDHEPMQIESGLIICRKRGCGKILYK